MGKIFYDMGLLSQAKVEDCSATDLIGQYVGQTGPKVQALLEKALGKVLFIDEAYRLAEGTFATEAMGELVDCLTKPKFAQKMVTILAGYDKDIDRLMNMNPGLTSRFSETVVFKNLDPETSLELLVKVLEDLQKKKKAPLDLSVITPASSRFNQQILGLFSKLSRLDSWGNARDVKSLAKGMFSKLISAAIPPVTSLVLTEVIVIDTMQAMLNERSRRNEAIGTSRFSDQLFDRLALQPQQQHQEPPPVCAPELSTAPAPPPSTIPSEIEQAKEQDHAQETTKPVKVKQEFEDTLDSIFKAKRDPGVSDAVWEQLERDKHAMVAKEREYRRLLEEKRQEEQRIEELWRAEKAIADEEERRVREQERIAAELERRRKEAILIAAEKEREKEKEMQKKLRALGRCPMGFSWIKQSGGFRCAGGSHWLNDAALGL